MYMRNLSWSTDDLSGARSHLLPWTLALVLGFVGARQLDAAESVALRILPADPSLFESTAGGTALASEPGGFVILGCFNDPRFTAASIDNLSLSTASGETIPLLVDGASVLKEFGRIVSLRLGAMIPARLGAQGKPQQFILKWGSDVSARNHLVDGFHLDSEQEELYRGFVWDHANVKPASYGEPVTEMKLTLIAERGVDWHKYWYLIPLGLLFVLLSARKLLHAANAGRV